MKRYITIFVLVLALGYTLYDNHKKSQLLSAYGEFETVCDKVIAQQEENLSLSAEIIEKQEFLLSN